MDCPDPCRPRREGFGLWILETDQGQPAGCVSLETKHEPCTAELTYLLHRSCRGQGLATHMNWTVIQHALEAGHVDQIIAGADEPNTASVAVMHRLGMTFLRTVHYPVWMDPSLTAIHYLGSHSVIQNHSILDRPGVMRYADEPLDL